MNPVLIQNDTCNTCENRSKLCQNCIVIKSGNEIILSDYEKKEQTQSEFWQLNQLLNHFSANMLKELDSNRYKGSMNGYSLHFWIAELHIHASKLFDAANDGNRNAVDEHSADCGIIAMKISEMFGNLQIETAVSAEKGEKQ